MNRLLDVRKYRAQYADLNAAFGDDWDAYLNHYLVFGAKEGRDTGTGTEFNALDYASRYADLQAAFGDDVLALWKHYQAAGAKEGREARPEAVIEAEREAEETARQEEEAQKPEETQKPEEPPKPGTHTEKVELSNGKWQIYEYDETGKRVKSTTYNTDGSVSSWSEYVCDEAGNRTETIVYNADGTVRQ